MITSVVAVLALLLYAGVLGLFAVAFYKIRHRRRAEIAAMDRVEPTLYAFAGEETLYLVAPYRIEPPS